MPQHHRGPPQLPGRCWCPTPRCRLHDRQAVGLTSLSVQRGWSAFDRPAARAAALLLSAHACDRVHAIGSSVAAGLDRAARAAMIARTRTAGLGFSLRAHRPRRSHCPRAAPRTTTLKSRATRDRSRSLRSCGFQRLVRRFCQSGCPSRRSDWSWIPAVAGIGPSGLVRHVVRASALHRTIDSPTCKTSVPSLLDPHSSRRCVQPAQHVCARADRSLARLGLARVPARQSPVLRCLRPRRYPCHRCVAGLDATTRAHTGQASLRAHRQVSAVRCAPSSCVALTS